MNRPLLTHLALPMTLVVASACLAAPAPEEPLTLERAIEIAVAQNPQVAVAQRRIEAAQARIGRARAPMKTTLDASGRYTRQGPVVSFNIPGGGSSEIVPTDSHNINLHAQKAIYAGGRLRRAPRAAAHSASAAEHDLETARQTVEQQVKRAYFGILKARRYREVAADAVKQAQEHLRLSTVQFEAGAVAKFDVIRSEVELANAQQQLVEAESGATTAEAALNSVLSRPLETPVNLAPVDAQPEFQVTLDTCLNAAEANRPEVQSLDANTRAATEQLAIAKAGKKPTVALSADYNHKIATAFGEDFDWNATLVVQLPLLDGHLTKSATREAQATVDQLVESRRQLTEGIAFQVKSAYLAADQSYRRIATATKTIEQAEEALRIARLQYQNGLATNVDVTDTELALTQAKMNEANAIYDYYLAVADLEHAVGLSFAEMVQAQQGAAQ